MGNIMDNDTRPIKSWRSALDQGILSKEQIALLEDMVQKGESNSVQHAADMLDWQDAIINKPEHMYGF
jgi:hypothetical protein